MNKMPVRIELPTIFDMKTVNSYLIKDPVVTLVDCGEDTDHCWESLSAGLKQQNLSIYDIEKVIITHAHVDHMGMAGRIARETGARVAVSAFCEGWALDMKGMWEARSKVLADMIGSNIPKDSQLYQFLSQLTGFFNQMSTYWTNIPVDQLDIFPMEGQIDIGGEPWDIIHTPGHAITQTCFFRPDDGTLLSADMILNITPTPVFDADPDREGRRTRSLTQMLQSYEKIRSLDVDMILPGHFEIMENHHEIIDNQVDRIHKRKDACHRLIAEGKHTFYQLFEELYKDRYSLPAVSMLIGYLDLLEDEDRIVGSEDGERGVYYSVVK